MRLSELMSAMGPTTFTIIGLLLFIGVFAGVVARTWWPGSAAEHARARNLPLEGDPP